MKWHIVMECASYEDICISYGSSLNIDCMHDQFDEDKKNLIANMLLKIYRRRYDKSRSNRTIQSKKLPHNLLPPQSKQDTSQKDINCHSSPHPITRY